MSAVPIVAAIISALGVASSTATSIANAVLSHSGGTSDDQSSLVQGYCNKLWHQLQDSGKTDFTVVIYKSSLNHELVYARGGYISFEQLGNAGYDIYFVANGYIKNNGSRGFENWCVQGNQSQSDNVITFT
jgi:hypothetical protein